MLKFRKAIYILISSVVIALSASLLSGCGGVPMYYGDTDYDFDSVDSVNQVGYCSLGMVVNGGDGFIEATVLNEVEIFNLKIEVVLDIYSSEKLELDFNDMTHLGRVATEDLGYRESLNLKVETSGETMYYLAVFHNRVGNGEIEQHASGVFKADGQGNFLGYR